MVVSAAEVRRDKHVDIFQHNWASFYWAAQFCLLTMDVNHILIKKHANTRFVGVTLQPQQLQLCEASRHPRASRTGVSSQLIKLKTKCICCSLVSMRCLSSAISIEFLRKKTIILVESGKNSHHVSFVFISIFGMYCRYVFCMSKFLVISLSRPQILEDIIRGLWSLMLLNQNVTPTPQPKLLRSVTLQPEISVR